MLFLCSLLQASPAAAQSFLNPPAGGVQFGQPLIDAAEAGNTTGIMLLLEGSVAPDARGRFGTTALLRAAARGNTDIAALLLKSGADANLADIGGATPLHLAARNGDAALVRLLLAHGANVTLQDNEGFTPLMRATSIGQNEVATLLTEAGAGKNTAHTGMGTEPQEATKQYQPAPATLPGSDDASPATREQLIAEAQAARQGVLLQKSLEQKAGDEARLRMEAIAAAHNAAEAAKTSAAAEASVSSPPASQRHSAVMTAPVVADAAEEQAAIRAAQAKAAAEATRRREEAEIQRNAAEELRARQRAEAQAAQEHAREEATRKEEIRQASFRAAEAEARRKAQEAESAAQSAQARLEVAIRDKETTTAALTQLQARQNDLLQHITTLEASVQQPDPSQEAHLSSTGRRLPRENAEKLDTNASAEELPPADWWQSGGQQAQHVAALEQARAEAARLAAQVQAAEQTDMDAALSLEQARTAYEQAQHAVAAALSSSAAAPLPWKTSEASPQAVTPLVPAVVPVGDDASPLPLSLRGKVPVALAETAATEPVHAPTTIPAAPVTPRKKPQVVIVAGSETREEKAARMQQEALQQAEALLHGRERTETTETTEAVEISTLAEQPAPIPVTVEPATAEPASAPEPARPPVTEQAVPAISAETDPAELSTETAEEPTATDALIAEALPLVAEDLPSPEVVPGQDVPTPDIPATSPTIPAASVTPIDAATETADAPDAQVQVAEAVSILLNAPDKLPSAGRKYKLGDPELPAASALEKPAGTYWLKLGEFPDKVAADAHFQSIISTQNLQGISSKVLPSDVPGSGRVSLLIGALATPEEVSDMCLRFRAEQLGCSTINDAP